MVNGRGRWTAATTAVLALACSPRQGEVDAAETRREGSTPPSIEPVSGSWEWDAGTVPGGSLVEHEFRFHNGGPGPLRIREVDSGCGCHDLEYSPDWIPEGGTGHLHVGVRANTRVGSFSASFHLLGEGREGEASYLGSFTLRGEAEILRIAYADPEVCDFGTVPPGSRPRGELDVVLVGDWDPSKPIEVRAATASGTEVPLTPLDTPASTAPKPRGGLRRSYSFRLPPSLPVGPLGSHDLELTVSPGGSGERTRTRLALEGEVVPGSDAPDEYRFVGMLDRGERRELVLQAPAADAPSLRVEASAGWLSVDAGAHDGSRILFLQVSPDAEPGLFEETLEVLSGWRRVSGMVIAGEVR